MNTFKHPNEMANNWFVSVEGLPYHANAVISNDYFTPRWVKDYITKLLTLFPSDEAAVVETFGQDDALGRASVHIRVMRKHDIANGHGRIRR